MRRAAAAPVRRLQFGLHQRRLLRAATERWIGTPSAPTSISATHFLDNIIDVNKYPLAGDRRALQAHPPHRAGRHGLRRRARPPRHRLRLGRGRGVRPQGHGVRRRRGQEGIERLAAERGPFPEWAKSIWGPDETCARDENGQRIRPMQLLRNCNVTTVAPTGTISIIAGCRSGLEPLFAVAFMRNQAGVMMPDVNEDFVAIAKAEGWYSDALMERIAKEGRVDFPEVPRKWQRVFVTANADRARMAHQDAGGLPGALRLGDSARRRTSRTRRRSRTCARSTSSRTT